jgi:hypothetical protein
MLYHIKCNLLTLAEFMAGCAVAGECGHRPMTGVSAVGLERFLPMIALAMAVVISACLWAAPARAQFEVEKPGIEKGEFEVEYHGGYFLGRPNLPAEADRQGHEFEAFYSLTDWLQIKGTVELEQERAEDGSFNSLKLSEVEGQGKVELVPLEGDGFGASFLAAYGESVVSNEDGSAITFGPILKAARGPLSFTANLFPVYSFGIKETEIEYEEGEAEVEVEHTPDHWSFDYAWQLKHKTAERWAFGVEGFGGFADVGNDLTDSGPNKHRLGPVVYLEIGDHSREAGDKGDGHDLAAPALPALEIAFGVLFGLNDDTSDIALKWDADFAF